MFSTLDAWDMLDEARVLDLFAGSGALGLEAASRGASEVALVEKHGPAAQVVRGNVARLQPRLRNGCDITVHRQSAIAFLESHPDPDSWDVVFIDPPYDFAEPSLEEVLRRILPTLRQGAVVMVERSSRSGAPNLPEGYATIRAKRYGETTLFWLEPHERPVTLTE